jgi:predicted nucleic acid-binding protein
MMVFVVDPSVVAGWFLPDERTETSDALALRMQSEDAMAPDFFLHELRSLLLAALRRGRIPEAAVYMSLDRLSTIPLRNAGMSDATSTTRLAIKHGGLSAYDSAYLELALREHAPLATADKKLAAAARAESVPIIGPLAP